MSPAMDGTAAKHYVLRISAITMAEVLRHAQPAREVDLTTRQNTKMPQQLQRMKPASTDDIRELILSCENNPDLHALAGMVRVIANTGLRNEEFMALRTSDIDPSGTWLHIGRPRAASSPCRVLPIRSATRAALVALHQLNPASELVLGETPRTHFNFMIRKLRVAAPQLARARLWTYSIRGNFESRLITAGIPAGIIKYVLGREPLATALKELSLTPEQSMQVVKRSLERFLEEL